MTRPVGSAVLSTVVLVLIALAVSGCSRGGGATGPEGAVVARGRTTMSRTPGPQVTGPATTDEAVRAAVRFELAHCGWDWRQPLAGYLAAQQAFATPRFDATLAAAADPVSWRKEVLAERQQVTCRVGGARRLPGAPQTPTVAYVRMGVTEQVTSTRGSFVAGHGIASWLVCREPGDHGGRWLVDGPFNGG